MLPRLTSLAVFAVAAAAAASAVAWGMKLFVKVPQAPTHASLAPAAAPPAPDWPRFFGVELAPVVVAEAAAPPPDARYQLIGVVAPRNADARSRTGVALIAVDGKPARAFRVGAVVDGPTVVQSVQAREVALGPRGGPAQTTLQLPPMPVALSSGAPMGAPGSAPELPSVIVPPPPSSPSVMPPMRRPQRSMRPGDEAAPAAPDGASTMPPGRAGLQQR
jgi:general secretion pathway protein C